MLCSCGQLHTVCISDGLVHSFGSNTNGQLGLGHNNNSSIPTPISDLPSIKLVSCGFNFTACVDDQGRIWSFGCNVNGQLGLGNTADSNTPQLVQNIPIVDSVSCGACHMLILTENLTLWSTGRNTYGELCQEVHSDLLKPKLTSFSNITKISAGVFYSLFQNTAGEIYGCGHNVNGQLGLGHFNHQFQPTIIIRAEMNVIQFCSGHTRALFLTNDGNVLSAGSGHNQLVKVASSMKNIFCAGATCILLDTNGDFLNFGDNTHGQLGFGYVPRHFQYGQVFNIGQPTRSNSLVKIKQVSVGCCALHVLVKDSQGDIYTMGNNTCGQLGDTIEYHPKPKLMLSRNPTIWGNPNKTTRAKSARK